MKVKICPYPKQSNKKRKISVEIDNFDIWNVDHTLALIIHPCLVKLRECHHGSSSVSDEDVPDKLKSTSAKHKKNEYDVDKNWHKRWNWVLDEMIFSFKSVIDGDIISDSFYKNGVFDKDGYEAHQARLNNGFRLFGKYYQSLWD